MMTLANRPSDASHRLRQKGGRGSFDSLAPRLCFRASQKTGMIRARPASVPGMMPAANIEVVGAAGTSTL